MSSAGSSSGHHGGGWLRWLVPVALVLYVIAVFAAYSNGMSPWVFVIATLGTVGVLWAGHHFGHVLAHFFHMPMFHIGLIILGAVAGYGLVLPLVEWRSSLTGFEPWLFMTVGGFGVVFLAVELTHVVHHSHAWQTAIGVGVAALLVVLYLYRPPGAAIALTPPITPRAAPIPSRPGHGGPSGGGAPPAAPASSPAFDPIPAEDLPDMFK